MAQVIILLDSTGPEGFFVCLFCVCLSVYLLVSRFLEVITV